MSLEEYEEMRRKQLKEMRDGSGYGKWAKASRGPVSPTRTPSPSADRTSAQPQPEKQESKLAPPDWLKKENPSLVRQIEEDRKKLAAEAPVVAEFQRRSSELSEANTVALEATKVGPQFLPCRSPCVVGYLHGELGCDSACLSQMMKLNEMRHDSVLVGICSSCAFSLLFANNNDIANRPNATRTDRLSLQPLVSSIDLPRVAKAVAARDAALHAVESRLEDNASAVDAYWKEHNIGCKLLRRPIDAYQYQSKC